MDNSIGTKEAAKDPVCRMTVDPGKAAATAEFHGQFFYYFCSQGCAAESCPAPQKCSAPKAVQSAATASLNRGHDETTWYVWPKDPEVRQQGL